MRGGGEGGAPLDMKMDVRRTVAAALITSTKFVSRDARLRDTPGVVNDLFTMLFNLVKGVLALHI